MRVTKLHLLLLLLVQALPVFSQYDPDSLREVVRTTGDDSVRVVTLCRLSRAYLFSEPDSSKRFLDEALTIATRHEIEYGIAFTHMNLGDYNYRRGEFALSLDHYLRSLTIFEKRAEKKFVASIHNNMGLLYQSIGAKDEAMSNFEIALAHYAAEGPKQHEANILNNIGTIQQGKGELEKARDYYKRSLDIREEIGMYKGSVLHNYGETFALEGDHDTALEYYGLALKEKEAHNRINSKASTLNSMGSSMMEKGETDNAYKTLKEAFDIAKSSRLREELEAICSNMAKIHAGRGEHKAAFDKMQLAYALKDSMLNPEMLTKFARLGVDKELQKMELENQILKQNHDFAQERLETSNQRLMIFGLSLILVIGLLIWIFWLSGKRKQANRDLTALNRDLEERVRQRTKSLEEKNEVLEKYAFDLSHRVRSPVASILGLAELLDNGKEANEENKSYVDSIKAKAESLDEVLHRINEELE